VQSLIIRQTFFSILWNSFFTLFLEPRNKVVSLEFIVMLIVLEITLFINNGVAQEIPKWSIFEVEILNNSSYSNKFRDIDLNAIFTSPTGRNIQFWGFFDGDGTGGGEHLDVRNFPPDNAGELSGNVWKLRFMPDEIGTWTYQWSFSDDSYSGNGSFVCVAAGSRQGVLKVNQTNSFWFQDGEGNPFFPRPVYILPGEQLCYSGALYGANVYAPLIAKGFNMIVNNLFPVWNWTTHQVHPDNGPADINIMFWYQTDNYQDEDQDEDPEVWMYDTERMNLFTWRRIDEHLIFLANQGIYVWGWQGFAVKRTFRIMPQRFPEDQGRWYIRYCMARLAPFYNIIWNHTWELAEGAGNFRAWVHEYDPWDRLYFQLDSDSTIYDISTKDALPEEVPDYYGTGRPIWITEDHGPLWGYDRTLNDSDNVEAMDKAWSLVCQGATAFWTEWSDNGRAWSSVATADIVDYMSILYSFIGDETNFSLLEPHRELVDNSAYCLANPGQEYVIYKSNGGTFNVTLQSGDYQGTWINPRTNERTDAGIFSGAGSVALTTPTAEHYALYLSRTTITSLQIDVLLDGPYEEVSNSMSTVLKDSGYVPLTSPYHEDPRKVAFVPDDVTDWILTQLSPDGQTIIKSKSVLLSKNGRFRDINSSDSFAFTNLVDGLYYIIVKHRNHLPIMSSNPILLNHSSMAVYNFTTSCAQFYAGDGARELEPGVWGIYGGDIDQDGQVTSTDYIIWYNSEYKGESGYKSADINCDGQIDDGDYAIWLNSALSSGVCE
jgi:hypothetical protein